MSGELDFNYETAQPVPEYGDEESFLGLRREVKPFNWDTAEEVDLSPKSTAQATALGFSKIAKLIDEHRLEKLTTVDPKNKYMKGAQKADTGIEAVEKIANIDDGLIIDPAVEKEVLRPRTPEEIEADFNNEEAPVRDLSKEDALRPETFYDTAQRTLGRGVSAIKEFYDGVQILAKGAIQIPLHTAATTMAGFMGLYTTQDRTLIDDLIDRSFNMSQEFQEKYGKYKFHGLPGLIFQDAAGMPQNLGFTFSSVYANLFTAVPTFLLTKNPKTAWAVGSAASGALLGRAAARFAFDDVRRTAESAAGRPLNEAEFKKLHDDYDWMCQKIGIYEAGWETLSNYLEWGVFGAGSSKATLKTTLTKKLEDPKLNPGLRAGLLEQLTGLESELKGAKEAVKKTYLARIKESAPRVLQEFTGGSVVEQASETATEYSQTLEKYNKGLEKEAPGIVDSYKKVFSSAILNGIAMGLGLKMIDSGVNKIILYKKQKETVEHSKDTSAALADFGASAASLDAKKMLLGDVKPLDSMSAAQPGTELQQQKGSEAPLEQQQQPVKPLEKQGPPEKEVPRFSEPKDTGMDDSDLLNAHGKKLMQDKQDTELLAYVLSRTIAIEEEHNEVDMKLLNDSLGGDVAASEAFKNLEAAAKVLDSAKAKVADAETNMSLTLPESGAEDNKANTEQHDQAKAELAEAKTKYDQAMKAAFDVTKAHPDKKFWKILKAVNERHERIDGLNRQREAALDAAGAIDERLIELMETENLKGTKEAADSLDSTDEATVQVSQLDKMAEKSWNAQLDKFMAGLKEGTRISLKYAKGAQKYLAKVVRLSSLENNQKVRMLKKVLSIQTPEQFAKHEEEFRNLIREMRTLNLIKKIRDEVERVAKDNPNVALKGKNKNKKTVDAKLQPWIKALREVFALTKEEARLKLAELRDLDGTIYMEDPKAKEALRAWEMPVRDWQIKALELIVEPNLQKGLAFYQHIKNFEKRGRAILDRRKEFRTEQIITDINEMVTSMNQGADPNAVSRFSPNERTKQEADARPAWDKVKDAMKKGYAPLLAYRAIFKMADRFNPIGPCTRLFADKITQMVNTLTKMTSEVHNELERIYEPINEICRKKISGPKYVKDALLPYVRTNYMTMKDKSYSVRLEVEAVETQREIARVAAQTRYKQAITDAKNAGRKLGSEERAQLYEEIKQQELEAMQKRLDEILKIPKGKENDAEANVRKTGIEFKTWKFNRRERMGLYALSKNKRQREMLTDMVFGNGIPESVLNAVIRDVTAEERAVVDGVRERVFNPLFEKAAAVNHRLFNFIPKQEEFYWPIFVKAQYRDVPVDNTLGLIQEYSAGLRDLGLGAMLERVESGAAPIDYDFYSTVSRHVKDTIHFIAYAENLNALNAYAQNHAFQKAIMKIITPEEYKHAILYKLQELGNPRVKTLDSIQSVLKTARETMTGMLITLKYSTGIQNLSTVLAVARRQGWNIPRVARVMLRVAFSPKLRGEIRGMSERIASRNRDRTSFLTGRSIMDEMQDGFGGRSLNSLRVGLSVAKTEMEAFGHMFLAMMDDWMAMTAWQSAYEYALNSNDSAMVENAEVFADGVLMDTQASYNQADLPTFLSGNNEYKKIVSSLYIFMNSQFQGLITDLSEAKMEWKNHKRLKALGLITSTMIARCIGPAVLSLLLTRPGDRDEPDEYMLEILSYNLGMVPILREFSQGIVGVMSGGEDEIPFQDVNPSLAYEYFLTAYKIAHEASDAIKDETGEKPFLDTESVIDIIGLVTGGPSAQAHIVDRAIRDYVENNRSGLFLGGSVLMGPKKLMGKKAYNDEFGE